VRCNGYGGVVWCSGLVDQTVVLLFVFINWYIALSSVRYLNFSIAQSKLC
jgi:hypothetical protein